MHLFIGAQERVTDSVGISRASEKVRAFWTPLERKGDFRRRPNLKTHSTSIGIHVCNVHTLRRPHRSSLFAPGPQAQNGQRWARTRPEQPLDRSSVGSNWTDVVRCPPMNGLDRRMIFTSEKYPISDIAEHTVTGRLGSRIAALSPWSLDRRSDPFSPAPALASKLLTNSFVDWSQRPRRVPISYSGTSIGSLTGQCVPGRPRSQGRPD